jgi:iron complex outermembrane receptor protein
VDPLDITVDVYRVKIDDRIVFSGNFTGAQVLALVQPFGASGGRFFTNAIDTRTVGYDVTAAYRFDLHDGGSLRLSAAYNRNDTDIVGSIATPPQLAGLSNVLFDREQTLRTTCGQPRDNLRLTGDWQRSRLAALARVSRYGEYCFATNVAANDQTFSPKWVTDLDVTFTTTHVTVGIGAQNLFDEYPDRLIRLNSSFLIQTFPSTSPFGMNGRFVYARVMYRF